MIRVSIIACLLAGALPVLAATLPSFLHARDGSFKEPLGLCETDQHVQQYSGYIKVEDDIELFFWFFAARTDPDKKPLVAEFGGGPGGASTRLAESNGPCVFKGVEGDAPGHNDLSFTTVANMIYIDQPVGVGFSKGSDDKVRQMDSTNKAAPLVWKFFQELYKHNEFTKFQGRDTGIFTMSYGGIYGPAFAKYILEQNAIDNGVPINLRWLCIDSGMMDLSIASSSTIDYAYENPYTKLLTKQKDYAALQDKFTENYAPLFETCKKTDKDDDCKAAAEKSKELTEGGALREMGMNFDVRYVTKPVPLDEDYITDPTSIWLSREEISKRLGAKQEYNGFSNQILEQFYETGDPARSALPNLSQVAKAGVSILFTAGDRDYICNHKGVQKSAESIDFDGRDNFAQKELLPWTVGGAYYGDYKTEGRISYLKVDFAGHCTPYYRPTIALAFFRQFLANGYLVSEES
ncbi:Uu.00g134450.m01.CDS01 [Anthostomella pinea]|uniref:Uu.00g134450.m01.CDS01 n=1 Tax=Anthostomella pinea TaxID=933095 RepID=A0AAI8VP08_9PEZI|nr:Uu.00g134450.m01.CDS01 [Anthostomella pinea]